MIYPFRSPPTVPAHPTTTKQSIFNPAVGNSLIDLGARSPFLRRHVLEQRHAGPVPQRATGSTSSILSVAPRRQVSSRSLTGGSGRHYTLMEGHGEEGEESA